MNPDSDIKSFVKKMDVVNRMSELWILKQTISLQELKMLI